VPDPADLVTFHGETFAMADRIGLMPLMRFAKFAKAGVDSADMAGLAALYDLLEQCIDPQDWPRFEACADKNRADGEELLEVVTDVIERLTDRPTTRPSVSSDGPRTVEPNSTASSSSDASRLLPGRPDLQLFVVQAQEARAAS
jgi:hypothetical protein